MMSYFTLNHGYNWCCYYYELVFFPSKTKDLVEGCMWLSLTFLVQDKEQKADKKREERGKKKKKIKQKDTAYEVTSEFFFLSAWDMTDVSCP